MDKETLRQQLRKVLFEIGPEQLESRSRKICENLIATPQFQKASVVMMYLPMKYEADTSEAVLAAWQQGKTVAVPKISWQQRHMLPVQINTLDTDFETEPSGLRNPVTGLPVPLEQIDLVVTPGLAFDRRGNRLGRGCSYYDTFFSTGELRAAKCGFAFDEQVVDSVPVTERDVPMDFLVTDKEVIYINDPKGA